MFAPPAFIGPAVPAVLSSASTTPFLNSVFVHRNRLANAPKKRSRLQCALETQPNSETTARLPLLPAVWNFRGASVQYLYAAPPAVTADTPAIVLVHGFGANCKQWRKNLGPLARGGYRVYALDLIGFGLGDKPSPGALDVTGELVAYNFDYWSAQLRSFVRDVVRAGGDSVVHFVSNSIGCCACMQAAVDEPTVCASNVFISPSLRLLNVRKRTWLQGAGASALMRLLGVRSVGAFFLNALAQPRQLRNVLLSAYKVADAVDDELLDILGRPAFTPGALDVFLAFIMFDEGPIPEDFLPQLAMPSLILWGEQDDFEPIVLGRAFKQYETVKEFVEIPNVGHCAHDEAPEFVNENILNFIAQVAPATSVK